MTTRCNSCSFIVEHIVIIGPSWPAQAHSEDMAVDEGRGTLKSCKDHGSMNTNHLIEAADTKATSDALNGPSKQNEDQYEEVALDEEGHGMF